MGYTSIMMKMTINVAAPAVRNPFAGHAMARKAGVMKHKSAPRGGGRNDQRDLLEEWFAETNDEGEEK